MVQKRKKAWVGTATAIAGIVSALASIGGGIASNVSANKAKKRAEQDEIYANNLQSSDLENANLENALNASIPFKNNTISTLSSNMKCGGKKRIKKARGGDFIKKCI